MNRIYVCITAVSLLAGSAGLAQSPAGTAFIYPGDEYEALVVGPPGCDANALSAAISGLGGRVFAVTGERTVWCAFPGDVHPDSFRLNGATLAVDAASAAPLLESDDSLVAAVAQRFVLATSLGREATSDADPAHPLLDDVRSPGGTPMLGGNTTDMTGTVKVAIMFVESAGWIDPDVYTWTTAAEDHILAHVSSGLAWWAARAAAHNRSVSFSVIAYRHTLAFTQQGYEPVLHPSTDAPLWVSAVMANGGYIIGDDVARVDAFNQWLRDAYGTDRAYTVFVCYNPSPAPNQFTDGYAAWTVARGGPYCQLLYRSFFWSFDRVVSHESGHIFTACDEYYQAGYGGCMSCDHCSHGYINGNCEYCNSNAVRCMMRYNDWVLCPYTPEHVGWGGDGACCFADGHCTHVLEPTCVFAGGTYLGADTTCSPNPCPQPGACCYPDGHCTVQLEANCSAAGGTYHGPGTSCTPDNPCPGACCFSNGACSVILELDCLAQGGVFHGNSTTCSPYTCPQPGACCMNAPADCHMSSVIWPGSCGLDGTYLGDNTDCYPNPCPLSCCFNDSHCTNLSQEQCLAQGGQPYWFDFCENWTCPPARACCFSDGHCEMLSQAPCESAGGWWRENSTCAESPCEQPGACCDVGGGGGCHIALPSDCQDWMGYHFLGSGTTCDDDVCHMGACCELDGTCFMALPWVRCGPYGTWQGPGTACYPNNPCPQPPGACCFPDGHCEVRVQADCSGEWRGAFTDCTVNYCPQPGACCYTDGHCEMSHVTYPGDCGPGGTYRGNDQTCAQQSCPPPGACCFEDGHCEMSHVTAPGDCAPGGFYQGDYTNCFEGACGIGACCFSDGHCEVLTHAACGHNGGDNFLGPGTSCLPNPCGPVGACCIGSNCLEMTEHACTTYNPYAHWLGAGVPCGPDTCYSACCFADGHCTTVSDDSQCSPQGGVFLGWSTSCSTNPCVPEPGAIIAWGCNGAPGCDVPAPNAGFIAADGGYYYGLGLKADGSIVAWGSCNWGDCNAPAPNTGFVGLAAGGLYNLGLEANGSIVAWGFNNSGQCNVPPPNTDFVAVAAGYGHSLGLKAYPSIVAWGDNTYGQCNVPQPNTNFVAVAAGWYHSLGLKANGSIVAWGWNYYGQCNVAAPNSGFVAVAGGWGHSLGLKGDGSIVGWGINDHGECNVPAPNTDFVAIAAGGSNFGGLSLGLKSNGSIVAWGSADPNVPGANAHFVKVAAGTYQSLGVIDLGPRACCLPDGQCQQLTQAACEALGGAWHSRTICDNFQCTPLVRACCFSDGSCQDLTGTDCTAQGGQSQPYPSICATTQCPQPPAACCFPDGHCEPLTAAVCEATGGAYQGNGTSCTPNACPQPLGACCRPDGSCQDFTQMQCSAAGGQYQGTGTTCTPATCIHLGDLNCDGVIDFDDIDPFVLALSDPAGYQAVYPNCNRMLADCNSDGAVDFDDIDPFVEILSGG